MKSWEDYKNHVKAISENSGFDIKEMEELVFARKRWIESQMLAYGFQKIRNTYILEKPLLDGDFKTTISVTSKGAVTGNVIDSMTQDEYYQLPPGTSCRRLCPYGPGCLHVPAQGHCRFLLQRYPVRLTTSQSADPSHFRRLSSQAGFPMGRFCSLSVLRNLPPCFQSKMVCSHHECKKRCIRQG